MIDINKQMMVKAFEFAKNGANRVFPNPFVGALLVKNDHIVGKGWHSFAGGPHAEVDAINDAKAMAKDSTLYVTLEPCSTQGNTPPCTDAIIKAGIKKVFFGAYDNNPMNRHKATQILQSNGIDTCYLDFQKEHDQLNVVFNHIIKHNSPYVKLKTAISLDGKISDSDNNSKWITSKASHYYVQSIRAKCDAIMVGAKTFNQDNPRLSIRYDNKLLYKDPAKIIISRSGKLNVKNNLLSQTTNGEVIIFTNKENVLKLQSKVRNKNCVIKGFDSKSMISLKRCLTYLIKRRYYSILVEGGSYLTESFLTKNMFNEFHVFIAPKIFGDKGITFSKNADIHNTKSRKNFKLQEYKKIENDIYLRYENVHRNY